MAMQSREE
jgi:hypothetical protein